MDDPDDPALPAVMGLVAWGEGVIVTGGWEALGVGVPASTRAPLVHLDPLEVPLKGIVPVEPACGVNGDVTGLPLGALSLSGVPLDGIALELADGAAGVAVVTGVTAARGSLGDVAGAAECCRSCSRKLALAERLEADDMVPYRDGESTQNPVLGATHRVILILGVNDWHPCQRNANSPAFFEQSLSARCWPRRGRSQSGSLPLSSWIRVRRAISR